MKLNKRGLQVAIGIIGIVTIVNALDPNPEPEERQFILFCMELMAIIMTIILGVDNKDGLV